MTKRRYHHAFAEAAEEVLRLRAWLEWMAIMVDEADPEARAAVLADRALAGEWPPTWLEADTRPLADQPPSAAAERERLAAAERERRVRALLRVDREPA